MVPEMLQNNIDYIALVVAILALAFAAYLYYILVYKKTIKAPEGGTACPKIPHEPMIKPMIDTSLSTAPVAIPKPAIERQKIPEAPIAIVPATAPAADNAEKKP